MAKINHILFGQGKGKVGGLVLQRYEGMNIVREKPISVKNPQSTKQTEQRAKFKLSSQILAAFSEVFNTRLAKLSIYARKRRSEVMNAIISVINTSTPDNPTALVDAVISAINAKSITSDHEVYYAGSGSNYSITAPNGYAVIFTVAAYDTTTGDFIGSKTEKYVSDGTSKVVELVESARNVLIITGTHALTDEGHAAISNVGLDSEAWENEITRSVASGDLEISDLTGTVITVA